MAKELDTKNVNFLLENMPPYAWFYGGRWTSNVFLSADDMVNYCKKTGLHVCYDLCHSQLYCNKSKISVIDEFKKIENYVDHFHLSDAGGEDGEGLQFGDGDLPFEKVIPILNRHNEKSIRKRENIVSRRNEKSRRIISRRNDKRVCNIFSRAL